MKLPHFFRTLAIIILLLAIGAWTLVADSATAAVPSAGLTAPPRNVLLIGWDGASRSRVQEGLEAGRLPTLAALSAEGAFIPIDVRGITDTTAGWARVLTGYDSGLTGAISNSRYHTMPAGYTIFERLKAAFGPDGITTLAVINTRGLIGKTAPGHWLPMKPGEKLTNQRDQIVVENGVQYRISAGSTFYNSRTSIDVLEEGFPDAPRTAARAAELLEQYADRPFFMFVYIYSPDYWGHRFGEDSIEYQTSLVTSDQAAGVIVQQLKASGVYDSTSVYVTADHGFNPGKKSHSQAPEVFLATNDPAVTRSPGYQADIAPTILQRLGVDLSAIDAPLSGRPLGE